MIATAVLIYPFNYYFTGFVTVCILATFRSCQAKLRFLSHLLIVWEDQVTLASNKSFAFSYHPPPLSSFRGLEQEEKLATTAKGGFGPSQEEGISLPPLSKASILAFWEVRKFLTKINNPLLFLSSEKSVLLPLCLSFLFMVIMTISIVLDLIQGVCVLCLCYPFFCFKHQCAIDVFCRNR